MHDKGFLCNKLFKQGFYQQIVDEYSPLIDNSETEISDWDLYFFARSLVALNKCIDSIQIFKMLISRNFNNESVKYFLLNEIAMVYFYDKTEYRATQLEKETECKYIIENLKVEELNERCKNIYNTILLACCKCCIENESRTSLENATTFIESIDVDSLSEEERFSKNENKPYFSEKEQYFAYKTKLYYKLEKWDDCISICNSALEVIKKWHHNDDVWIKDRKYRSILNLKIANNENSEKELLEYEHFTIETRNPWVYMHFAEQCYNLNLYNKALNNFCFALMIDYDKRHLEAKIKIIYNLAILCEKFDFKEEAKNLFALVNQICQNKLYEISNVLNNKLKTYSIDEHFRISYKCIINFCVNQISKTVDYHKGIVLYVKGNLGFIKTEEFPDKKFKFFIDRLINPTNNKNISNKIIAFKIQDEIRCHTMGCFIGV